MEVGKLYQVKNFCWFIYPTTDQIEDFDALGTIDIEEASKHQMEFLVPNDCFVVLDSKEYVPLIRVSGMYYRILSPKGIVGWIAIRDWNEECFEEMNP